MTKPFFSVYGMPAINKSKMTFESPEHTPTWVKVTSSEYTNTVLNICDYIPVVSIFSNLARLFATLANNQYVHLNGQLHTDRPLVRNAEKVFHHARYQTARFIIGIIPFVNYLNLILDLYAIAAQAKDRASSVTA